MSREHAIDIKSIVATAPEVVQGKDKKDRIIPKTASVDNPAVLSQVLGSENPGSGKWSRGVRVVGEPGARALTGANALATLLPAQLVLPFS